MSKTKNVAKSLTVILVTGAVVMAGCFKKHACNFHKAHDKMADWMVKHISSELDLSKDQKKELTRIKDEILAKHKELEPVHQEIHEAFIEQMKKDRVDQAQLSRLFEDKVPVIEETMSFFVEKYAEFHDILTPEQREKLIKKMDEFHSEMKED
jgi:periplasmic protein CpxP/Spy